MTLHLVRLAINNIRSRRTRSWLTILGVLIGVTAVVSLLSIGTGVEQAVLQQFKDIGYDIIVITQGGNRAFAGMDGGPGGPPGGMRATGFSPGTTFSPEEGEAVDPSSTPASASSTTSSRRTFSPSQIGASSDTTSSSTSIATSPTQAAQTPTRRESAVNTEALLKAVPELMEAGNLGTRIASVDGPLASGFLRVTTPSLGFLFSFPSILGGFKIASGTTFTNTMENEVVIGARSAESLGLEVGDSILIDQKDFTVVGILAPSKAATAAEESSATSTTRNGATSEITRTVSDIGDGASFLTRGMTNTDDSLFVLQERASSLWSSQATNSTTIVRMATGVKVDQVMTDISTELTAQGVSATPVSVQQIAGSIQGTLGMIETVLASIAAVALIVGGVGLMNTMYTSVLERTREIGILKAVGARDGQVMALFLVDSGLMGLIGGVLGLLLGGVLSWFGTRLLGPALGVGSFQPVFGATLIVGVLVASFVIGALSGAWPAWRASRLNPVEALAAE
jgi:putative ABC transport system permease protein